MHKSKIMHRIIAVVTPRSIMLLCWILLFFWLKSGKWKWEVNNKETDAHIQRAVRPLPTTAICKAWLRSTQLEQQVLTFAWCGCEWFVTDMEARCSFIRADSNRQEIITAGCKSVLSEGENRREFRPTGSCSFSNSFFSVLFITYCFILFLEVWFSQVTRTLAYFLWYLCRGDNSGFILGFLPLPEVLLSQWGWQI